MLIWPRPDTRSRSLTFWSSENLCAGRGYNLVIVTAGRSQQVIHAGGDDRQPPCGAFLLSGRDILIDLLKSGLSVRPPPKGFPNLNVIWSVGKTRPHMRTSMTSTWSGVKVKVKVTELLTFRKPHFSGSISSAIFAWTSKLMVGGDGMGPGLQLVWAHFRISFYESYHWSSNFAECPDFVATFPYCVRLQSHGQAHS